MNHDIETSAQHDEVLRSDALVVLDKNKAQELHADLRKFIIHENEAHVGSFHSVASEATLNSARKIKMVQERSNSTGKLYNASRRVSFPENEKELVTGYLEPADPWASGTCN